MIWYSSLSQSYSKDFSRNYCFRSCRKFLPNQIFFKYISKSANATRIGRRRKTKMLVKKINFIFAPKFHAWSDRIMESCRRQSLLKIIHSEWEKSTYFSTLLILHSNVWQPRVNFNKILREAFELISFWHYLSRQNENTHTLKITQLYKKAAFKKLMKSTACWQFGAKSVSMENWIQYWQ